MNFSVDSKVKLRDGNEIPVIGFGVFQMDGGECENAVREALNAGYRHIDTALVYNNEGSVGKAVAESGVAREDLFITTKSPFDLNPGPLRDGCEGSLKRLRTDYVDLYLVHWPIADEALVSAWETLVALQQEGKCRSIGISNFTIRRMEEVLLPNISVTPVVNQIEFHVYNQHAELVEFCRKHEMAIEAYSPLSRGQRLSNPAPALEKIAVDHGKSVAQVMIRWVIQQGTIVLPKSATASRIRQNIDIFDFELSAKEMQVLAGLNEDLTVQDWFPKNFY